MAEGDSPVNHGGRNFIFEQDVPTAHMKLARRINRLLQAHRRIDEIDQYLNMSLW